ncbi:MAG: ketose-bisphosphate aldolase [Chitinivibrionales bacterium]|nr:ketose-bisphosphate aldolase [Chitinivibrionales bacterium]
MPLVSAKTILAHAQQHGYAVPLFDIFELTGLEDYFAALEDKQSPAITGMYATTFEKPLARPFVAAVRAMAEQTRIPVALMLDHGKSVDQCRAALDMGFTDVMYDGSKLPFEENVRNTIQVVESARSYGVGVEAELGHVGSGSEYRDYGAKRQGFTEPPAAEQFVADTGVDMLAVAIGTAHGAYDGDPSIDLELLAEIRSRINIPLVLHGGSGLSEKQFRDAITGGIAKVNVATDLVLTMGQRLRETAAEPKARFFDMMGVVHAVMRERCGYYLELFGAAGRAEGVGPD